MKEIFYQMKIAKILITILATGSVYTATKKTSSQKVQTEIRAPEMNQIDACLKNGFSNCFDQFRKLLHFLYDEPSQKYLFRKILEKKDKPEAIPLLMIALDSRKLQPLVLEEFQKSPADYEKRISAYMNGSFAENIVNGFFIELVQTTFPGFDSLIIQWLEKISLKDISLAVTSLQNIHEIKSANIKSHIKNALTWKDKEIRFKALHLRYASDRFEEKTLLSSLKSEDEIEKAFAITILGENYKQHQTELYPALEESLKTNNRWLIESALGVYCDNFLEIHADKVKPFLSQQYPDALRATAGLILGHMRENDDETVRQVVSLLKSSSPAVRIKAIQSLGFMNALSAITEIILAVHDKQTDVRQAAILTLAWLGDDRATEPLIHALSDEDMWVRKNAAYALGEIRAGQAMEALLKVMKNDPESIVRIEAIKSLGKIGDTRITGAVIIKLKTGNEGEKIAAASMLGDMKSHEAVDALLELLRNEFNEDVIAQTALALGRIGDKKAGPDLFKKYGVAYENTVAYYCAMSVGMVGESSAKEKFQKDFESEKNYRKKTGLASAILMLNENERDLKYYNYLASGLVNDQDNVAVFALTEMVKTTRSKRFTQLVLFSLEKTSSADVIVSMLYNLYILADAAGYKAAIKHLDSSEEIRYWAYSALGTMANSPAPPNAPDFRDEIKKELELRRNAEKSPGIRKILPWIYQQYGMEM